MKYQIRLLFLLFLLFLPLTLLGCYMSNYSGWIISSHPNQFSKGFKMQVFCSKLITNTTCNPPPPLAYWNANLLLKSRPELKSCNTVPGSMLAMENGLMVVSVTCDSKVRLLEEGGPHYIKVGDKFVKDGSHWNTRYEF